MTELLEVKAKAKAAREQLTATANYTRTRLKPASLFADGRGAAKQRAISLATATLLSRKSRFVVALSAAMVGTGYLFRKPIARYFLKHVSKEKTND